MDKPQVTDFTALLWHHIVVLLLLTHSCGGQSEVTDPPQPIVAVVGDDVILPCHLKVTGNVDAAGMTVEWARPDLEPRFVHLRRGGVELLLEEHPLYTGRTSLFINNLKCGDVSMKLSKVKLSDAGTYKCFVPTPGTESVVQLAVGSVSSPEVDMSTVSDGVLLECKSKGWYPEPEVFWLDGEGNLLSAGPTETVRGPDDLYTVSRRLTVEKSDSFICRVQQKNINQTRETHIHVPAELFVVQSSSAVRITIFMSVCFMFIGAVVFIMWRMRQIEKTNNRNELDEEGRHMTSERMKHLDETKAKLEEDLQKKEEELEHVREMITTLTEEKKNLKEQRENFTSLLQDDKAQIEAIKKKIKDGYKVDNKTKTQKAEHNKAEMEERQKKHNEMLQNTEKLQDTTEDLIIKMTERKTKIEKDKEQMNKNLIEVEKERETERRLESERLEREKEEKKERETEMKHESEQSEGEKDKVHFPFSWKGKKKNKNDPSSSDAVI